MNINHLQYFQMLAKTKNFSAAAERCFTTQPNLSYGIKTLEEELGVALIERGNRRAELTQAGEMLVVDEKHPLAGYDSVNLWQIKDYRLIRKPGGSTSKEIDVLYKKAGLVPIVMENAPTLMVVLGLVESRMGIGLVTDTRDVDGFQVKKIRIDWPKQDFFYSIFFKKDAQLSWATRLVCTYIINENGVDPGKSLRLLHGAARNLPSGL